MNFAVADMADELDLVVREIAAHPRADSRFMATYGLLAELNVRRDQYGVALAVDSSRQTLRHLENMDEGISVTRDVGGAATGVCIGPHFANEWLLLELARSVADIGDEQERQKALALVVHETLINGETLCWEVMPMIGALPTATGYAAPPTVITGDEVAGRVADNLNGLLSADAVYQCLVILAGVIEDGTQLGRAVTLPGLGTFTAAVKPNGEISLVFKDGSTSV